MGGTNKNIISVNTLIDYYNLPVQVFFVVRYLNIKQMDFFSGRILACSFLCPLRVKMVEMRPGISIGKNILTGVVGSLPFYAAWLKSKGSGLDHWMLWLCMLPSKVKASSFPWNHSPAHDMECKENLLIHWHGAQWTVTVTAQTNCST